MVELLRELLHRLSDVRALVAVGGMVMVCGIIFVETGLFVGFFLPGDSLLVTAGVFAGAAGIAGMFTSRPLSFKDLRVAAIATLLARRAMTFASVMPILQSA